MILMDIFEITATYFDYGDGLAEHTETITVAGLKTARYLSHRLFKAENVNSVHTMSILTGELIFDSNYNQILWEC